MNIKMNANVARLSEFGELADVASDLAINLTSAFIHVANTTWHLLKDGGADSKVDLAAATDCLQQVGEHFPQATKITENVFEFLQNFHKINSSISITAGGVIAEAALLAHADDSVGLEHAPELTLSALIKVYVLSFMAVFSLIGNALTMWNIYKTRIARRSSRHNWSAIYTLIFNLSIADALVTFFCIIGDAAWYYTVQWMADDLSCRLLKLLQMFSLYLSTYVLVLIGVDRWVAVKYPMKSLNMAKRCYRLLGGTYILALALSLPQFFIFHVARGPFVEEFYQCVTHGFYTSKWQEQTYTTSTLIFTFLLPLSMLSFTYLSTFSAIQASEKMFQGSKLAVCSNKQPLTQTNRQRLIHKAKMKSLRMSIVIIIAFLVCWTPYNVMMLMFMFWNPDQRISDDLQSAIFFFGMSNSLVNPLIYGAFHGYLKKKRSSKGGNQHKHHGVYSLKRCTSRGDSQRTTTSMLTAVTQFDYNGRQIRSFKKTNYYRSISMSDAATAAAPTTPDVIDKIPPVYYFRENVTPVPNKSKQSNSPTTNNSKTLVVNELIQSNIKNYDNSGRSGTSATPITNSN